MEDSLLFYLLSWALPWIAVFLIIAGTFLIMVNRSRHRNKYSRKEILHKWKTFTPVGYKRKLKKGHRKCNCCYKYFSYNDLIKVQGYYLCETCKQRSIQRIVENVISAKPQKVKKKSIKPILKKVSKVGLLLIVLVIVAFSFYYLIYANFQTIQFMVMS